MKESLVNCKEDVNSYYNDQGDALLHRLVKKPFPKKKTSLKRDLLTALLTYSDAKVNDPNVHSRTTPLHLAAKVSHNIVSHASPSYEKIERVWSKGSHFLVPTFYIERDQSDCRTAVT